MLHNGEEQVAHDLGQIHVGVHGADELAQEHRFFVAVARQIVPYQPSNFEIERLTLHLEPDLNEFFQEMGLGPH